MSAWPSRRRLRRCSWSRTRTARRAASPSTSATNWRSKRIDFGPVYFLVESTYMVTEASGLRHVDDVDRPGIRVVGIAGTTTIRAAARSLKNTTITAAQSIGEAVEMITGGKADAFALSRDSLPPFVAKLPGSRIVDGGFQLTGVAIAVPKGQAEALAY